MIYIKVDEHGQAYLRQYTPFDEVNGLGKTKEELEVDGFFVDSIPSPEVISGKEALLKGDFTTKSVWYEYIDRPISTDEELKQLKEKQSLMQQAIDDLIFGGAM